jgi:hypothetical protein
MTNSDFPWFKSIIVALIVPLIGLIWHKVKKYLHNRRLKHSNPFTNLSQIRKNEIRRIARQIMTGQSSAIIGAFEKEKTDILNVLDEPTLYGDKADSLIFSKNVDIASLKTSCDQAKFWKQALKPRKKVLC